MTSSEQMGVPGKVANLGLLSLAQLLAMSLWFSASAVVPQLEAEWGLGRAQQSALTMSLQLGFVVGALLIGMTGLADRVSSVKLVVTATLLGALANALIPLVEGGFGPAVVLRALTGVCMAGVYPPSIRLAASWTDKDRGLGIGILVGALAVGSAVPHLLNAVPFFGVAGMPPWRSVLLSASVLAVLGAVIMTVGVREGPYLTRPGRFEWRFARKSFTERAARLANFGYVGHMWELYAAWTWVPIFLLDSYAAAGLSAQAARMAGFALIAVGGFSSVVAGYLADRLGRTTLTVWSLAISGVCCLLAGPLAARPLLLTALCLIWGLAIIADSAQFSAAVSELVDPEWVGTAVTAQVCVGFLVTMIPIRLLPVIRDTWGWTPALAMLALGPLFGIASMLRLRALPEATRMASGRR